MSLKTKQKRRVTILDDTNLSHHTKVDYKSKFGKFLKFSKLQNIEQLIDTPSNELQNILQDYCHYLNNEVKKGNLSPNTVPKMFKPIKYLLDVNYRENEIKWRPIKALYPTKDKLSGYKPYTNEQIKEIETFCKTPRNLAFLHFMASVGGRIGIHEHPLLMKHLIPMSSDSKNMDCYAVLLYAEQDETPDEKDQRIDQGENSNQDYSYYGFLTPEATKFLKKYHAQRRNDNEEITPNSPIFRTKYQSNQANDVKQLSRAGGMSLMSRLLNAASIHRIKKGRRYDVQLDHGFRKRFNTILKLQNELNSNIAEKIMGHKRGLDGTYLTPTRDECFKEFKKAIIGLTISDVERQKIELKNKTKRITELEKTKKEIEVLRNGDKVKEIMEKAFLESKNSDVAGVLLLKDAHKLLKTLIKENKDFRKKLNLKNYD